MRILYVADGRSPIALSWMSHFVDAGDEVHLASTFPCRPDLKLASLAVVPVAFSELKASPSPQKPPASPKKRNASLTNAIPVGLRTSLRHWLAPLSLPRASQRLQGLIQQIQPDLVHAMRIPYEGMLAGQAVSGLCAGQRTPLVISTWGNDFTLHAPSTPWMARRTRQALAAASGLHADCRRDLRLAHGWGFPASRPAVVLPGNGGLQSEVFCPPAEEQREPLVVNPRGMRAYVRNDTFFQAIPLVLARRPEVRFACPNMSGEPQAEHWLDALDLAGRVELLPMLPRPQMAAWFQRAAIAVSPTTHDGTPNTLLEAMACGCFPVAGDLESLREWITPGVNGLLVDPADPTALAQAILLGLDQPELRWRARQRNPVLIAERAEQHAVMAAAGRFYQHLAGS